MSIPLLSIILVIDSDRPSLAGDLKGFLKQTCSYQEFELLILDYQEGPNFKFLVNDLWLQSDRQINVSYIRQASSSRSAVTNLGIRQAEAEILLFLTADFYPNPALIQAHLDFHRSQTSENRVGVGPGFFPKAYRALSPFSAWLEDSGQLFGYPFANPPQDIGSFFYLGNSSLRRSLLEDVGYFDEDFPYFCGDDHEMGLRLSRHGAKSTFLTDAVASHLHLVTHADRMIQMEWAGKSHAILCSKYPDQQPAEQLPWWKLQQKSEALFARYFRDHQPKDLIRYWDLSLRSAFLRSFTKARPLVTVTLPGLTGGEVRREVPLKLPIYCSIEESGQIPTWQSLAQICPSADLLQISPEGKDGQVDQLDVLDGKGDANNRDG